MFRGSISLFAVKEVSQAISYLNTQQPNLIWSTSFFAAAHHSVIPTLLPYSPLGKKSNQSSFISQKSEVPKGVSILQTLPKILTPGHKWPSRPFKG